MKDCSTDDDGNNFTYKPINHENFQIIKKHRNSRYVLTIRENARKRANGEIIVPKKGNVIKLAASERAKNGVRACNTTNCTKTIQYYDGLGGGYCGTCAPESLRSLKYCSVQGCSKIKKWDGKWKTHCDKNNPKVLADKLRNKCSVQGCSKIKCYDGKCKTHCDKNNAQYLADKLHDRLKKQEKRRSGL